jgi:hypothetical protein
MVPHPGIYLSAVARATKQMRLGALVFLLPLYTPLRLLEELAMLDHLSHGRLDVGIGRGVSPFELNFHKVKHDQSREIFLDAYDCLLKGFTHETGFGIDAAARIQYDLDFLVAPSSLTRARAALASLGYVPHGDQSLSDEHSRPLVRPSSWCWRGDYFDTEMHIPIELHDSLWSPGKDRIPLAGVENFWTRRCSLNVNGLVIPALAETDRLAFAALHALRHILRHDARPAHVLELARFLDSHAADTAFWTQWRDLYPPHLKALQIVAFRFAQEWFQCACPEAVIQEWSRQPQSLTAPVTSWFQEFAWSPVENLLRKRPCVPKIGKTRSTPWSKSLWQTVSFSQAMSRHIPVCCGNQPDKRKR